VLESKREFSTTCTIRIIPIFSYGYDDDDNDDKELIFILNYVS